jgi:hypothetical protein
MAVDRLVGGKAGGVADFAPVENRRSTLSSEEIAGDNGLLSRLGFFGLMGGAGLRWVAAEAADDRDLRDGDGEMFVA